MKKIIELIKMVVNIDVLILLTNTDLKTIFIVIAISATVLLTKRK